jgi:hypothetical protein
MGFDVGRVDGSIDYRRVAGGLAQVNVGMGCADRLQSFGGVIYRPIGKLVCGSIAPLNPGPTNAAVTLIGPIM